MHTSTGALRRAGGHRAYCALLPDREVWPAMQSPRYRSADGFLPVAYRQQGADRYHDEQQRQVGDREVEQAHRERAAAAVVGRTALTDASPQPAAGHQRGDPGPATGLAGAVSGLAVLAGRRSSG